MKRITTIDEYIENYPLPVQKILVSLKTMIHALVPNATESISYGIPSFKLQEYLIHFGAFKHHIGIYPTSSGIREFSKEFARYVKSKGTLQFPLDEPIPYDIVKKLVLFRLREIKNKYKSS